MPKMCVDTVEVIDETRVDKCTLMLPPEYTGCGHWSHIAVTQFRNGIQYDQGGMLLAPEFGNKEMI